MIILVGASASGKSVVAKKMFEKYNITKVITYTTRPIRVGEVNGVDYHFVSKEDFEKKIDENFFVETANYNNNYYGTAYEDISKDKVLIVEPNGANVYYDKIKDKVIIVYLNASEQERKKRMAIRGDSPENIEKRLIGDVSYFDFKNFKHIDLIIETENKTIENISDEIIEFYRKKFQ